MIKYEDGKPIKKFTEYYLPQMNITTKAKEINGLNRDTLKKKGAKVFSKGASERIVNFLNEDKDLPIVAHNVWYDLDKALMKTFKRVNMQHILPPKERWRCTMKMSQKLPGKPLALLDDILEYFNYDRRDLSKFHDAMTDAGLTAQVYMKMMTAPPPSVSHLGFTKE